MLYFILFIFNIILPIPGQKLLHTKTFALFEFPILSGDTFQFTADIPINSLFLTIIYRVFFLSQVRASPLASGFWLG